MAAIGTWNPRSFAYASVDRRTAARIRSTASGVCARSTAAVRTPPLENASNTASADVTLQTSGSVWRSMSVKPARLSVLRLPER